MDKKKVVKLTNFNVNKQKKMLTFKNVKKKKKLPYG